MKKLFVGWALVLLTGCGGSGPVQITYHEVDWGYLQALEISAKERSGYAIWEDKIDRRICDIFMLPKYEYRSVAKYHEVLGHETRHCFEGDFH